MMGEAMLIRKGGSSGPKVCTKLPEQLSDSSLKLPDEVIGKNIKSFTYAWLDQNGKWVIIFTLDPWANSLYFNQLADRSYISSSAANYDPATGIISGITYSMSYRGKPSCVIVYE